MVFDIKVRKHIVNMQAAPLTMPCRAVRTYDWDTWQASVDPKRTAIRIEWTRVLHSILYVGNKQVQCPFGSRCWHTIPCSLNVTR